MRRLLIAVIVLLVLAAGGYGAYWFVFAGRIPGEVEKWAERERSRGLDVSYSGVEVSGFPGPFRVTLTDLRLGQQDGSGQWVWSAERVNADLGPLGFKTVSYIIPGGGKSVVRSPDLPDPVTGQAERAHGTVVLDGRGRPRGGSITIEKPVYTGGGFAKPLTADRAWFETRHRAADSKARGPLDFVWRIENLSLPVPDAGPFGPLIKIAQGKTTLTQAGEDLLRLRSSRAAAAAWRDAGGKLEIEDFGLEWGPLAVSAKGTLGLDQAFRLEGQLQTRTQGYQQALAALVKAGEIGQQEAMAAGLVLDLIAKKPEGGSAPVLAVPLTARAGELYLGPRKISDLKPLPFPN